MKIYDCITYFEEEFLFNLRLKILDKYVDYFVVCESIYSHKGEKKSKLFNPEIFKNYKHKIIHLVLDKFPENLSRWERQDYQRDFIFEGLKEANDEDLIIFSDSDEIPDPKKFQDINFKYKFFLFDQKHFCYKFNIINHSEYLWEGTRGCKMKNLKSFNWLRTKIKKKNLNYSFWRFDKVKNIQIIENGGWHFSYFLSPTEIVNKINSSPHEEFINDKNLDKNIIQQRILSLSDPLGRKKTFKKINEMNILPEEITTNFQLYKEWFI